MGCGTAAQAYPLGTKTLTAKKRTYKPAECPQGRLHRERACVVAKTRGTTKGVLLLAKGGSGSRSCYYGRSHGITAKDVASVDVTNECGRTDSGVVCCGVVVVGDKGALQLSLLFRGFISARTILDCG